MSKAKGESNSKGHIDNTGILWMILPPTAVSSSTKLTLQKLHLLPAKVLIAKSDSPGQPSPLKEKKKEKGSKIM